MIVKNLLELMNNAKRLSALDYAVCEGELVNFLDLIAVDEQFTQIIDLGVVYLLEKTSSQYTIVDGLGRILSLSLLLHAICECYKKTSGKNDKAINTIRQRYLLDGVGTKLKLPSTLQPIYEKIIYGERLSGKEKKHPIFILLHNFWTQIKEDELKASDMFRILEKICVTIVEVDNVNIRNLYYSLNREKKALDQILLIDDFLSMDNTKSVWNEIKAIFQNKDSDITLFLDDFFRSKFNYKEFDKSLLYVYFYNYCKTLEHYMSDVDIISKMKHSAELYSRILNIETVDEFEKKALIKIKLLNGEDTYSYLLSVYEDYSDGSISEATFHEILTTVTEYLESRKNTPNNVSFNELIKYLNAFLAYK